MIGREFRVYRAIRDVDPAMLGFPKIIGMNASTDDSGRKYLIMQLLGPTLSSLTPMPLLHVLNVGIQMVSVKSVSLWRN